MPRPTDPRLEAIYAKVPAVQCKGLCADSCGPVPLHPTELAQIRRAAGRRVRAMASPALEIGNHLIIEIKRDGHCTLLRKKRCTIYKDRPLICRLYGVAAGLPCRYGCLPERLLSHLEVEALMMELSATRPRR